MLRWMTPFLVAIFATGTAAAAEDPGAAKTADSPAAAKPADNPAPAVPTDNPATAKPASAKSPKSPSAPRRAAARVAGNLPPGLPRPYYKYRTTVAPAAPPLYVRRGRALVVVEEESPDVLLAPLAAYAPRFSTPLLPGSAALPGYYGSTHSYSYDGPYYGGPYEPYWNRLPYACGVYGYC